MCLKHQMKWFYHVFPPVSLWQQPIKARTFTDQRNIKEHVNVAVSALFIPFCISAPNQMVSALRREKRGPRSQIWDYAAKLEAKLSKHSFSH